MATGGWAATLVLFGPRWCAPAAATVSHAGGNLRAQLLPPLAAATVVILLGMMVLTLACPRMPVAGVARADLQRRKESDSPELLAKAIDDGRPTSWPCKNSPAARRSSGRPTGM